MKKLFIALASIIFINGCASKAGVSFQNSPYISSSESINLKYGKSFASPSTILAPLPTSVVVMKNPIDINRNSAICNSFTQTITSTTSQVASASSIKQNIISSQWLIKNNSISSVNDCNTLLANYDFARANTILQALELNGNGPYLVAFIPGTIDRKGISISVDLSKIKTTDYNKAFSEWNKSINQATNEMLAAEKQGDIGKLLNIFLDVLKVYFASEPLIGSLITVVETASTKYLKDL